MAKPTIGKCKNFSIPKAGLIYWFEEKEAELSSLDYGLLDIMHRIVDIAGGNHISLFTSPAVTASLRGSPYWKHETIIGFHRGMGNGSASMLKTSEKGIQYYSENLKNRTKKFSNKD